MTEVYSDREFTRRGTQLKGKQMVFRLLDPFLEWLAPKSGRKALCIRSCKRYGKDVPPLYSVWAPPIENTEDEGRKLTKRKKAEKELTEAQRIGRSLEGHRGVVPSAEGLGVRVEPEHLAAARLKVRPKDPRYDSYIV